MQCPCCLLSVTQLYLCSNQRVTSSRSWFRRPITTSSWTVCMLLTPTAPSSFVLSWELIWGILQTQEPKKTWKGQPRVLKHRPHSSPRFFLYKVSYNCILIGNKTSTLPTSSIEWEKDSHILERILVKTVTLHSSWHEHWHFSVLLFFYQLKFLVGYWAPISLQTWVFYMTPMDCGWGVLYT